MRQEGRRRPLSFESSAPASRDRRRAGGARAVGRNTVVLNQIAIAGDETLAARLAERVLEVADLSWKVARVDVPQTRVARKARGLPQHRRCRGLRVGHLVVLVEGGD